MTVRLLLVLLFVSVSCAKKSANPPGDPPIRHSKPGLGNIVILGDSLARGAGATDPLNTPSSCLKQAFGVTPINVARDGLDSSGIINDPDVRVALRQNPKLIFISLGGNDAIRDHFNKGSFPASETYKNMEEIFTGLLRNNALVVYLALNPPYPGSERLPRITAIARGKGVLTIDALNGLWGDGGKMADEFHPNDDGYRIVCDRILAALKNHFP